MTPEKAKEMNADRALENGEQPVFPLSDEYRSLGLSKREYISTTLLSGSITDNSRDNDHMIQEVIRVTDELLIALNKNR